MIHKKRKLWLLVLVISFLVSGCQSDGQAPQVHNPVLEKNLESWGLGEQWVDYVANDRPYDWYLDQGETGEFSNENCGPTSAAMAAKWFDEKTPLTPEIARQTYANTGGWWYTSDIESIFKDYKVPFEIKYDYTIEQMTAELYQGRILLICNNMDYIPLNRDESQRLNRFYAYNDGHFLIVKGYLKTEKGTFFEVYDPNSWGKVYEEGALMGKDRYYESSVLLESIENWWDAVFVIGQ